MDIDQGSLDLAIGENAAWPYVVRGELLRGKESLAEFDLELKSRFPAKIGMEGGQDIAFGGKVKVTFPAKAVDQELDVDVHTPDDEEPAPYYLDGFAFEITAISQIDGLEVNHFSQPITIEVNYDEDRFITRNERSLSLFYYDTALETWVPLPSRVDPEKNLLTAWSDHLTEFDIKVQDWESARLPGLSGFQISPFTGAASYSIPIEVPPGPGGQQPSLSLSFNSQAVNNFNARTQASWVGLGWSLEGSSIQRNMNGTPDDHDDDTFTLQVNGVGGMLLPVEGDPDGDPNTTDFKLAEDNFWRIRRYASTGTVYGKTGSDTSYWIVWDKEGNQYSFGKVMEGDSQTSEPIGHAWYPAYPTSYCSSRVLRTWQWGLTRERDIFGQEITYTYTKETANKTPYGCASIKMDLAIYPDTIVYANNRYRVRFYTATIGGRTDYDTAWANASSVVFYKRNRLDTILIEQDADGDGISYEQVIRKYILGYEVQHLLPGVHWPAGGYNLTLTSVREYGLGGLDPLPGPTSSTTT